MSFTHFIAIDWSGAKGTRHKGIAVAVAQAGEAAPRLILRDKPWSRTEILHWLLECPGRPLIGFDFSFAPPFLGRGAYLPGVATPDQAPDFWAWLDRHCPDADLGAASFLEETQRPHFYFGAKDGRKADYMHLRQCEIYFNAQGGGKPSSIFDCIGAAQVAKASFAGMRLLHRLHPHFSIWPFQAVRKNKGVVVEIYTRNFLRMAGGRGLKIRNRTDLNLALKSLDSQPWRGRAALTDHITDVLVSAAGLRRIADQPAYWRPAPLTPALASREGWTFGIL